MHPKWQFIHLPNSLLFKKIEGLSDENKNGLIVTNLCEYFEHLLGIVVVIF